VSRTVPEIKVKSIRIAAAQTPEFRENIGAALDYISGICCSFPRVFFRAI